MIPEQVGIAHVACSTSINLCRDTSHILKHQGAAARSAGQTATRHIATAAQLPAITLHRPVVRHSVPALTCRRLMGVHATGAAETEVPSFGPKMVCTKCGTIGADARPNWREVTR